MWCSRNFFLYLSNHCFCLSGSSTAKQGFTLRSMWWARSAFSTNTWKFCNSFVIRPTMSSFFTQATVWLLLRAWMSFFKSKFLHTSWVVRKLFAARSMLYCDTFAPTPAIVVLHALFKCSMCKSHDTLFPIPPLLLINRDHLTSKAWHGGSPCSWSWSVRASNAYFVRPCV